MNQVATAPKKEFLPPPKPRPGKISNRLSIAAIRRAFRKPVLPRKIRSRRTRYVNRHPDVKKCRATVARLLANTYPDPDKIRESIERKVDKGTMQVDEAIHLCSVNPGRFGDWYGDNAYKTRHVHLPDREELAKALNLLIGTLIMARAEAAMEYPAHLRDKK